MPRPLALLALTCVLIPGCACRENLAVANDTDGPVHAQLALPWPSYAMPARGSCQFEFHLAHGEEWTTHAMTRRDHAELPLRWANGVTLLRVRQAMADAPGWEVYELKRADGARVSLAQSAAGTLQIVAEGPSGEPLPVEPGRINWFK